MSKSILDTMAPPEPAACFHPAKPLPATTQAPLFCALAAWSIERMHDQEGWEALTSIALWPVVDALWRFSGETRRSRYDEIADILRNTSGNAAYWQRPYWAMARAHSVQGAPGRPWQAFWDNTLTRHVYAALTNCDAHRQRMHWRDLPWRTRELHKLHTGEHVLPVWYKAKTLEPIPDHFAHVSPNDGAMVRFAKDARKAQLDPPVYTSMNGGRYLARYYPALGADEVRKLATKLNVNALTLAFAKEPALIERVYTTGPPSCMSHPRARWGGSLPVHPVCAYGAGDLAVAYLLKGGESLEEGGHIVARCVCWPDKAVYSRIYGDHDRMAHALREAGYRAGTGACFKGAHLSAIPWHHSAFKGEAGTRYILPYLDGHAQVTIKRDASAFRIGEWKGKDWGYVLPGTSNNGYSIVPIVEECAHCGTMAVPGQNTPLGHICTQCTGTGKVYLDQSDDTWTTAKERGKCVNVCTSLRARYVGKPEAYCECGTIQRWSEAAAKERCYMDGLMGYYIPKASYEPVTVHLDRAQWEQSIPSYGHVWRTQTWAIDAARCWAKEVEPGVWVQKNCVKRWEKDSPLFVGPRLPEPAQMPEAQAWQTIATTYATTAAVGAVGPGTLRAYYDAARNVIVDHPLEPVAPFDPFEDD